MPRYVIDIAYKGTAFFGSQVQPGARTVQEELNKSLSKILRKDIKTYFAGRTDRGVHGSQMPAHFDLDAPLHKKFLRALNAVLPRDIAIGAVYEAADPDFNARFHAISRSYVYQIMSRRDPMQQDIRAFFPFSLNFEAMSKAAPMLLEYESFESFCKTGGSNKTFLCDMQESKWEREGDFKISYHVTANRFLRGMVRAIVGTMIMVGREKIAPEGIREIIEAKDRSLAGTSVDPEGLTLARVRYPEGSLIPLEMDL